MTTVVVIGLGPYTLIAMGSGYAFSRVYSNIYIVLSVSTAAVFLGAWVGSIISFIIGRFLCRDYVKTWIDKKRILKSIDAIIGNQGLKLIILLRLCMLVPFCYSNYTFGASSVKMLQFVFGTLGLIPMVLFFVYIGTSISSI